MHGHSLNSTGIFFCCLLMLPAACRCCLHCSYRTLAEPHNYTLEVKKSKFIATAWPTSSAEQVIVILTFSAVWAGCEPQALVAQQSYVCRIQQAAIPHSLQAMQHVTDASDSSASHNCFAYKACDVFNLLRLYLRSLWRRTRSTVHTLHLSPAGW